MFLKAIGRGFVTRSADTTARREVRVRVCGGYVPDTIRAEAGVPLRIVICREESAPCSEQVVFPAFGKSAMLPPGERVAVNVLPEEAGEYEFTCAMGMLRGKLVVVPSGQVPA
jgi:plastocyanin domain-containing protein